MINEINGLARDLSLDMGGYVEKVCSFLPRTAGRIGGYIECLVTPADGFDTQDARESFAGTANKAASLALYAFTAIGVAAAKLSRRRDTQRLLFKFAFVGFVIHTVISYVAHRVIERANRENLDFTFSEEPSTMEKIKAATQPKDPQSGSSSDSNSWHELAE